MLGVVGRPEGLLRRVEGWVEGGRAKRVGRALEAEPRM